jgi:hypothetical protein
MSQLLTKLVMLDLSETQVTDAVLEGFVANNPGLETVHLQICPNLSARAVDAVARHCKHLTFLLLVGTRLDDCALMLLADHCLKLRWLKISHQDDITDAGIRHLARNCRCLKTLIVGRMEIMGRSAVWDEFPRTVDVQLFAVRTLFTGWRKA